MKTLTLAKEELLLNKLYDELGDDQRMILVPSSTNQPYQGTFYDDQEIPYNDENVTKVSWKYYEYARTHPKVLGLMPWGRFTTRTVSMPILDEMEELIGNAIVNYQ